MNFGRKVYIIILVFVTTIVFTSFYLHQNYIYENNSISKVEITLQPASYLYNVILFTQEDDESSVNFERVYRGKLVSTTKEFELPSNSLVRTVRIYFEIPSDSLYLKKVTINGQTKDLQHLTFNDGVECYSKSISESYLTINEKNGFIELSKKIIYKSDLIRLCLFYLLAVILIELFTLLLLNDIKSVLLYKSIHSLSIIIFFISIFLPHPLFNIALVFSLLIHIKRINIHHLLISNKIAVIIIIYFLVLFSNDLLISDSGYQNLKATETYLPFLILPLYISAIEKKREYLHFIPLATIIMGFWFVLTSTVDYSFYLNGNTFIHENLTKYLHPVYFSYLISFSILITMLGLPYKKNILVISLLTTLLILCGSKMIITFTLVIILISKFKRKKTWLILLPILLSLIFITPPLKQRFTSILNLNDLNILSENPITNPHDPRINGITLRLIIHQEALKTFFNSNKLLFGFGKDKSTDLILSNQIKKRGLSRHFKYSIHNQYLSTLWHHGLIGLILLLSIIIIGLIISYKKRNILLSYLLIMLCFAFITEPVFERVCGIYFFTTFILFLSYIPFNHENSPIRN